uniref:3-keto-5-aminohexanoate cleavage protein n=1 Tax=Bosea sp. NBC_00436 TaxID=2969620 RepID=A0A9E7ZSA3_9HYPH
MNRDVFITCAVTGGADMRQKHPGLPVTPEEIATSAIRAARAGAAIVHIHARDPQTGLNSRNAAYFARIVNLIREADTGVILNITGGNGGSWVPPLDCPLDGSAGDVVGPLERLDHVEALNPDICTLDCGVMNFGESVYLNTPRYLAAMAGRLRELGIKPELEAFDLGHVRLANKLVGDGLIGPRPLYQFCLDVPWGAQADAAAILAMRGLLPADALWSAFGISRMQMPMVAQAILLGGHVRVGLEDNLYLDQGMLATNEQLVERAALIIRSLGARVLSPAETRQKLGL